MRNLMQARLAQLRAERAENEKGFTLIELLVVVVIIGILIAIAIPLYLHFENGAKTSSAESDVHNAVAVVQQCQADNQGVFPATATGGADGADMVFSCGGGETLDATVSNGNTMTYTYTAATSTYTITVKNADSGKTYKYDSSTGKTAPVTTP